MHGTAGDIDARTLFDQHIALRTERDCAALDTALAHGLLDRGHIAAHIGQRRANPGTAVRTRTGVADIDLDFGIAQNTVALIRTVLQLRAAQFDFDDVGADRHGDIRARYIDARACGDADTAVVAGLVRQTVGHVGAFGIGADFHAA